MHVLNDSLQSYLGTTIEFPEIKDIYRVKNVMLGQTFMFSVNENNKITFGDYYEWFTVTE